MLKTYHINGTHNASERLNIAECDHNEHVILSIEQGEQRLAMTLNYQQYQDLCSLRYSLDLVEVEIPTPESKELALCAA